VDPDALNRLLTWLPYFAVVAAFIGGLAALLSWVMGRAAAGEALRTAQALNDVMTATALRRDRRETLARILDVVRQSLSATSGTLHLAPGPESMELELLSAVGVARLDLLQRVPADDPLWQTAAHQVAVAPVPPDSRWAGLTGGRPGALAMVALHGGRAPGALTLCWPDRQSASAAAGPLARIGAYVDQVLGEFYALAQQAEAVRDFNEAQATQVELTQAAAHDMGNLLTAPIYFFSLVRDRVPPELSTMGETARNQLLLASQMLTDFVSPDRPLEPAIVSVDDLVGVAAAMGSDKLSAGTKSIRVDAPVGLPNLLGERLAILRVLDNLICNAIRHNADVPDLQVLLSVRAVGDDVQFSVHDSGRGIPPEAQSRLFHFGVGLDPRVKGHGIGLWYCRKLIEAHGGRIWVESEPGLGATFVFTIPIATEARIAQHLAADSGGPGELQPAVPVPSNGETAGAATPAVSRSSAPKGWPKMRWSRPDQEG